MKKTLTTLIIAVSLLITAALALVPELRNRPTPAQVIETCSTRVIYPDYRTLPVPPTALGRSFEIIHPGSR